MNLGRLNKARLEKLATQAGISLEELEKALRKNPKIVARYGAIHSTH
ncbi:hypothetical protein [Actinomadura oligospora]|nr:hypothetical protein [Actinomadura oligospora]